MATVTKPIALDESFNTTEVTPRNIADVLAEGFSHITGRTASEVEYDNTESGLTADNVQDALDEIVEDIPTVPTVDIQTAVDEFETFNGGLLSSLKVALTPNQDLHGYDEPWVGGAGKNKLPLVLADIKANNTSGTWSGNVYFFRGCNFTVNTDNDGNVIGINVNRVSADANNPVLYLIREEYVISTSMILNGCPTGGSSSTYRIRTSDGENDYGDGVTIQPKTISNIYIRVEAGYDIQNVDFYPMLRLSTESDPTFERYSNICPISGHTQVDVDVSDGDTTQEQVTVNLGGTYYSGTLDVVSGVLTVDKVGVSMDGSESWNTHGAINHGFYCDNVIPSGLLMDSTKDDTAISNEYNQNRYDVATSMDNGKFAYGLTGGTVRRFILRDDRFSTVADLTTALGTTNLQLVMELAAPTPIQLSPTMVKALVGENHLSAPLDGQEITESKYKQAFTFDDVIAYIQSLS